jgi:peptidyl-prolyl cis-trans isomerase D
MFDLVRNNTRLMLGLVLLLIIPSFIFFGVEGYTRFTDGTAAPVAEVDGRKITRAEWDAAHQRTIDRLREQMPGVDAALLDTPAMKRETLDAMVRERVLLAAAAEQHLAPGDARLQRLFVTDPQFAGLRNADGSVNRDLLAAQGMSSEEFAQRLRTELAMQQVLSGVSQTGIAPSASYAAAVDALLQRREVQIQRFDPAAYRERVQPTDAELEAFHKAHEADFRTAEQARIEYVVLDLETLARDVAVPEEDLRRYYEENASRYTKAEERRASHILIAADRDRPAAERDKARERAKELLAQARARPDGFAALAREHSQDPGSAPRGGDLDFFARGAMVKSFEDAVFAMKPGEISDVVETDFGFHVIRLDALRGGDRTPFDAVRAEIESEVRRQLAQRRYAEAAEQFTNMVYEQPDSLQPVIERFKLQARQATVQRTPGPDASGPLASAKLLAAVFGNEALANKRNTDAVEVGASQLASARVLEHLPARTRPLAEVRDEVRERVVAEQAARLARQEGEARLAALRQAPAEDLPQSVTLSRRGPALPRAVVDAALGADPKQLPAVVGVDLGGDGYAVLRVTKVLPRDVPAEAEPSLRSQYAQAWAAAEAQAYLEALKQRHKARVTAPAAAASAPGS